MIKIIDKLCRGGPLCYEEYLALVKTKDESAQETLASLAHERALAVFSNKIYIRGLIEFTNHCKNNCLYCGIRAGNLSLPRYRLEKDDILACCKTGYELSFRTFVLQGGEDPYFNDDRLCAIVSAIRERYSDCAITLSVGERSYASYKRLFDAGANRYLLRHESASTELYKKLHPAYMSLDVRKQCLYALKDIGYQVGCGFMVGAPFQTDEDLAHDLKFIEELSPHMVGIGPFIPHKDTPFCTFPAGSVELTLRLISILRLMNDRLLLPATTALSSADKDGRVRGILAGANVVMPNLSPLKHRKDYALYDGKIATDEEAAEGLFKLREKLEKIGYEVSVSRGDFSQR